MAQDERGRRQGRKFFQKPAVAALVCLAALLAACASPKPPKPVIPPVDIPAQVRTEFQEAVAAWNAGNLDRFLAIYADTATFAVPDGFLQGRQAIRDFYAPNFERGAHRSELILEQVDVEVLSIDTVLVQGIYQNRVNGEVVRRGPTTLIMKRWLGRWRIIHDHSS